MFMFISITNYVSLVIYHSIVGVRFGNVTTQGPYILGRVFIRVRDPQTKRLQDFETGITLGFVSKVLKHEVEMMWHHYLAKSQRSSFKKILLLQEIKHQASFKLETNLGPKARSTKGCFEHQVFHTWTVM